MSTYIRNHWLGNHSLPRSLGLNAIAFNIGMVVIFSYLTHWVEKTGAVPDNVLASSLIVFWICVLCWQAVGAFRAASKRIANYGSVSNYYIVLAVVLLCSIFTLASVATQYGEKIDYTQQAVDAYKPIEPTFKLVLNKSAQLVFTGDIGYGATKKLRSLLKTSPGITQLILHSDGGLIVEARGMANVVKEHRLNTSVSKNCYSACTIVFIAGTRRNLTLDAKLGFHQYKLYANASLPWIEPSQEQLKDLSYFQEKNVAPWFMEQAYKTPHSSIWAPNVETLFAAGVITTKIVQP